MATIKYVSGITTPSIPPGASSLFHAKDLFLRKVALQLKRAGWTVSEVPAGRLLTIGANFIFSSPSLPFLPSNWSVGVSSDIGRVLIEESAEHFLLPSGYSWIDVPDNPSPTQILNVVAGALQALGGKEIGEIVTYEMINELTAVVYYWHLPHDELGFVDSLQLPLHVGPATGVTKANDARGGGYLCKCAQWATSDTFTLYIHVDKFLDLPNNFPKWQVKKDVAANAKPYFYLNNGFSIPMELSGHVSGFVMYSTPHQTFIDFNNYAHGKRPALYAASLRVHPAMGGSAMFAVGRLFGDVGFRYKLSSEIYDNVWCYVRDTDVFGNFELFIPFLKTFTVAETLNKIWDNDAIQLIEAHVLWKQTTSPIWDNLGQLDSALVAATRFNAEIDSKFNWGETGNWWTYTKNQDNSLVLQANVETISYGSIDL